MDLKSFVITTDGQSRRAVTKWSTGGRLATRLMVFRLRLAICCTQMASLVSYRDG